MNSTNFCVISTQCESTLVAISLSAYSAHVDNSVSISVTYSFNSIEISLALVVLANNGNNDTFKCFTCGGSLYLTYNCLYSSSYIPFAAVLLNIICKCFNIEYCTSGCPPVTNVSSDGFVRVYICSCNSGISAVTCRKHFIVASTAPLLVVLNTGSSKFIIAYISSSLDG